MNCDPTDVAETIIRLAPSGLFDEVWYAAHYPESVAQGGSALVHFCNEGWLNGCKPNFYFDTARYLDANPDVFTLRRNPLLHYLDYGEAEGRWPSIHFDPVWYRAFYRVADEQNALAAYLQRCAREAVSPAAGFDAAWYGACCPDVAAAHSDVYQHYALYGAREGRDPSPQAKAIRETGMFDADYYLRTCPGAADSGFDPLYHFCSFGWREGAAPNAGFDTKWYLSHNDDVRNAGVNPFYHYLQFGLAENRWPYEAFNPEESVAQPPPSAPQDLEDAALIEQAGLMDINYYLISYPDVRASKMAPLAHFCSHGWREGRRPNPYFDPDWYAKTYLGADTTGNPLVHYIRFGETKGHLPIVYFDPSWYRARYGISPGMIALRHFLEHRRQQTYSPTPFFDIAAYIGKYGARVGRNRDPFAHYLRIGITEDINPGADFDARSYRRRMMPPKSTRSRAAAGAETHEKIRRESLHPLVHFLLAAFALDSSMMTKGNKVAEAV